MGSASSSPTVVSGGTSRPSTPAIHREEKEKEKEKEKWRKQASLAQTRKDKGRGRPNRTHSETTTPGRPDSSAYNVEQERIKAEIDVLQAQLVSNRCVFTGVMLTFSSLPCRARYRLQRKPVRRLTGEMLFAWNWIRYGISS